MPPSYRERLRVEGLSLAALCAASSAALVAFVPDSRRRPESTIGQLIAVALLLEFVGTRKVRRWLDDASEVDDPGTGEPTPLWMLPPIVAGLTAVFVALPETGLPFSDRAGWDAGLRVTAGCALVGLAQGVRWERVVAASERSRGRRYIRVAGSHLWSGTTVGYTKA
jgi:hypothetical protein